MYPLISRCSRSSSIERGGGGERGGEREGKRERERGEKEGEKEGDLKCVHVHAH